jgi:hypothetical protein
MQYKHRRRTDSDRFNLSVAAGRLFAIFACLAVWYIAGRIIAWAVNTGLRP